MSFRDNLQYLRAERNMTQEQLAMLLGVSRQSVTKWEAEKSQPEMDKLLKMCQLFDCTLDELVTGDLTSRGARPVLPADSAAAADGGAAAYAGHRMAPQVPAGPPQDICGYDEHQRMMAWKVPTGISAIIAFIGIAMLFEGSALSLPFAADPDTIMVIVILLGVLVGLAFLIPAGMEHSAFMKAHPYIEDFYTEDDRLQARQGMARGLIAGVGLIFAGVGCIMLLGSDRSTEMIGLCLLLLCIAAGVWAIVRYGMLLGRTNVAEYNKDAVDELEVEDIVNAQLDEGLRESLLQRKRHSEKLGAVCAVIMIVATIIGLCLLFAPVLTSSDPDNFEPLGTSASWFWIVWPVGGMICGIVALLWEAFGKRE